MFAYGGDHGAVLALGACLNMWLLTLFCTWRIAASSKCSICRSFHHRYCDQNSHALIRTPAKYTFRGCMHHSNSQSFFCHRSMCTSLWPLRDQQQCIVNIGARTCLQMHWSSSCMRRVLKCLGTSPDWMGHALQPCCLAGPAYL